MLKVLIVDDELLQRQLLNQLIDWKSFDMEVVAEAENGREAVQLCKQLTPDIVVMDINIPLINGIEAAKMIKKKRPASQIIILTAYGEFEYAKEALEIGVLGFVLKPLEPKVFIKELMKAKAEIANEKGRHAYIENAHILRNISSNRDDFLVNIRLYDTEVIVKKINEIFLDIEENNLSRELVIFISVNLFLTYAEFLEEKGIKAIEHDLDKEQFIKRLNLCKTIDEIRQTVISVISDGLGRMKQLTKASTAKKVGDAQRYIETNYYRNGLGLSEIAESIGMNASYLSNVFKNECGYSLSNYISMVRLKKAKELMGNNPKATLSAISEKVGYSDSYYFSKSFKNHYGVTPSKYMDGRNLGSD
jgi:two-component system response regulator YesN